MKTKINPAAIGMFITGAVVILFVSVALFGRGRLFHHTRTYLLTFREPANGLNIGAPVKMLGVTLGEVSDISIIPDPSRGGAAINVLIEIDRDELSRRATGVGTDLLDRKRFERALADGLCGRLQILSLLSSQLYVSLGPAKEAVRFQLHRESEHGHWEIPTVTSTHTEIIASVMSTLESVSHFDLKTISQQLTNLLVEVRADLAAVEFGKVNARVLSSLDKVDFILDDPALRSSFTNLDLALVEARQLAGKLNRGADPLLAKLDADLQKADSTLTSAATAFNDLKALIQPGSPVSEELLSTLEKAGRALDAFRELSQDLQRNPNSILTGKAPEKP
jgi:paraquat-inducible protein B